jgi:predicted dehydrogenase
VLDHRSSRVVFAVIGSGWRARFYLRIARALPERFEVAGVVARSAQSRREIAQEWGVPVFTTLRELLDARRPDFVVVCVERSAAPDVIEHVVEAGLAVLCETPPGVDVPSLERLHELARRGARIQVAEQYHRQPMLSAQIAIAHSGELGGVSQAQVSVCHDYHAVSLVRRFLGIGFESPVVTAHEFVSPVIAGPTKAGDPVSERMVQSSQVTARLDFGDRLGVIDFSSEQYFSWVRSNRVLVRGDRGEIADERVSTLIDFRTPSSYSIERIDHGHGTSQHGLSLRGLMARGRWIYMNETRPAALSDDEIAIAECLACMGDYVDGGDPVYSLAEASQDQYLQLAIRRALVEGRPVRATTQSWATSAGR